MNNEKKNYQELLEKKFGHLFSKKNHSTISSIDLSSILLNFVKSNSSSVFERFFSNHFFFIIFEITITSIQTSDNNEIEKNIKTSKKQKRRSRKTLKTIVIKKNAKNEKKKNAMNKIIDLIKKIIFMMTEYASAILQKIWNDMTKEFNKIFIELE